MQSQRAIRESWCEFIERLKLPSELVITKLKDMKNVSLLTMSPKVSSERNFFCLCQHCVLHVNDFLYKLQIINCILCIWLQVRILSFLVCCS